MSSPMGVITLAYLTLALPVVSLSYPDQWLHKIYVDNNIGINSSSCWEGGYSTPCLSLNMALTGAQHYNHSTAIILQLGEHQLHSGSENKFSNISQLAILGNGIQGEIVIKCEPLAGLAFFWSQDIELRNVTLVKCGALQNSTSKPAGDFLQTQVAVLLLNCKTVQLTNAHVNMSNGTGIVVHNPEGVVNITNCLFSHNGMSAEQEVMYGGGGLVIEGNDVTSQSFSIITNSTFTHNTASSGQYSYLSPATNPSRYFSLGRGGGISVVFRGGAANNTVQLDKVHLENNMAQFGGGLFLAFYDGTKGNTVSINNANVTGNEVSLGAGSVLTNAIGGGAFVGLASGTTNYPSNNTVTITSSEFIGNEAYTGGGAAVDVVYNDHNWIFAGNKLSIENCALDNNNAIHGSLVYLSQNSESFSNILNLTICCSNFTNGNNWEHVLPCSSSVFLLSTSLILKDTLIFSGNNCSAVSLQSSFVKLLPSTQLEFIDNQAINGAALHIVDCSSIVVSDGSTFLFKNNTASILGGAIFAESCSPGRADGSSCFIQHSNPALHPDDWNVSVTFDGNIQQQGSHNCTIYMDTINTCIWPDSVGSVSHNTFCWKGWSYLNEYGVTDNCLNYLWSGPASMNTTLPSDYLLCPGKCTDLSFNFTVYDAWEHDITQEANLQLDIISSNVQNDPSDCQSDCDTTTSICLSPDVEDGDNYTHLHSKILIHPPQLPGIALDLSLKPCKINGNNYVYTGFYHTICDNTSTNSPCNTYFYNFCLSSLDYLPQNDMQMCGRCAADGYGVAFNYPNFMCAKCEPQGWILFIFLQLVPLWIMIILLAALHINITNGVLNGYILYSQLVSLQFPGLGFTSWLPTMLLQFPWFYKNIPLIVYSIWNLNLLTLYPIPVCLPPVYTAAGVIVLQYVIAACPLVFIIVTYTWIRWYNNGYKFVVYTTRPVHQLMARFWQKFEIRPSLIDTYAGLILLSYMRFLTVSVILLQYIAIELTTEALMDMYSNKNVSYIGQYTPEHVVLGIVAVMCILVFVVPPMVVLLFYHLKIFQQCLTWCKLDRPGLHALVDAYQGCFKNSATDDIEARYFAGLFLLFRFCYLVLIVLPSIFFTLLFKFNDGLFEISYIPLAVLEACLSFIMAGLVVIMRPYKKIAHNVIDFLILVFLTVIGATSVLTYSSFYISISAIYLPFIVLLCYLIFRLLKFCCCACVATMRTSNIHQVIPGDETNPSLAERKPLLNPPTTSEVKLNDCAEDDGYADRIMNPSRYNIQAALYKPASN